MCRGAVPDKDDKNRIRQAPSERILRRGRIKSAAGGNDTGVWKW